jgi:hypothetical protein
MWWRNVMTRGVRDAALRSVTDARMRRSRDVLDRFFDPVTDRDVRCLDRSTVHREVRPFREARRRRPRPGSRP